MVLLLFHYQNVHFRVLHSDLSFELKDSDFDLGANQAIQSLDFSLLICKLEKITVMATHGCCED